MTNTTSILLISLVLLSACNSRQNQPSEPTPLVDSATSDIESEVIIEEKIQDEGPSIYEIRHMEFQRNHLKEYMASHHDTILWDSDMEDFSPEERIVVTYNCLFDSGLIIKPQYFSFDTTEVITHNYVIDFQHMTEEDTVEFRISKESLKEYLTDELYQNAVIFHPTFQGITDGDSLFHFSTSISVPSTDIGIGLRFAIDRNGNFKID